MHPQKKLLANPESRDLYSKAQQKPIKNAPAPLRVKWWGPKHLRPSYLCELNLYQKFQSSSTAPFDKIVGKFATTQCDEKGLNFFLKLPFSIFSLRFQILDHKRKVFQNWILPTRTHFQAQNRTFRQWLFKNTKGPFFLKRPVVIHKQA